MIRVLSFIFLFSGFSLFGMNDELVKEYKEISDPTVISLLDAYMNQAMKMNFTERRHFMFSDYKSPMLFYSLPIKFINRIVYKVSEFLGEGMSEEDQPLIEDLFNKLETDPVNLTELEATNIQTIRMGDFLIGQDLEGFDQRTKDFIMANRIRYHAAWATRDDKTIEEAMKNCQLFPSEKPYVPLSKQIIMFKQKALLEK